MRIDSINSLRVCVSVTVLCEIYLILCQPLSFTVPQTGINLNNEITHCSLGSTLIQHTVRLQCV